MKTQCFHSQHRGWPGSFSVLSFFLLFFLFLSVAPPASANPYGSFYQDATADSLKPFCRDLGGILGAGTFSTGRVLGFSGFDLGEHGAAQFRPDRNDGILRSGGLKAFGLALTQGEIGMPFRLDGFVRGGSYQGLTIAGGGIRYGLIKVSDKNWAPQLLASVDDEAVVHDDFSANHAGGSLVYSMGTPSFKPYAGAGVDWTKLSVRSAATASLVGQSATTLESRFTAGIRVEPWSFLYINAAYILLHGQSGAEGGLGVRF